MPCKICGTELVFVGQWPGSPKCPKCDSLRILDRSSALQISRERLEYLDQLFVQSMRKFNRDQLIGHIVWAREKYARSFCEEYQFLEMSMFVSYSHLIRRLIAERDFSNLVVANDQSTEQLIDLYSTYLGHRNEDIYLQNGFAELMAKSPFDFSTLTLKQKLSNFVSVCNEKFLPIHETYANNEIYDEAAAKRKFEEYSKEREVMMKSSKRTSSVPYSPQAFIHQNFPILNSLYCGLRKNEIYAEQTFDFASYKKASISPSKLMDLVNAFPIFTDKPTIVEGALLRVEMDKIFDGNLIEIEKALVFNQNNQETFPLLVELNDQVLIPHRTAYLVFAFLHPFLHKDLFNAETERRSKELEANKTKLAFESAGFRYYPNLTDKKKATLEIDGIAIVGRTMYVVEVKAWGMKTFFEHKEGQQRLERDLRGVVDGYKYSTIDGQPRTERIVSLQEKIQFVERNMEIWGLDPRDYDSFKGIIVIKDYPPINEYKGVRIV